MFSKLESLKMPVPRLKSLQHRKRRLFLIASLTVITNILIYGLLMERNVLPAFLQSSILDYDTNVYNQSILNLVSRSNGTKVLPTMVPRQAWVEHHAMWYGFRLPIITCMPEGRLGNVMGEYATLYALHRHYNVTVFLHPQMKYKLGEIFPHLTIPVKPDEYGGIQWKKVANIGSLYNYTPIELAASGLLGPHHFKILNYPFEIQLFQPFKESILKEFKFSMNITKEVDAFLSNITATWKIRSLLTPIFVGFHVRRTDYVAHVKNNFGASLPDKNYFNRAMKYYRKKFGNATVFIAASDDRKFLKSNIGGEKDIFFTPGTSATSDLAVLSSCNHSIITMGSFSFWTGYLTGGEVVYPDVKTSKEYRFSRRMFEKSGLPFVPLPVSDH